ncbi:MAG: type II toxin-antitoxin system VapC family toxin [Alphaproteobacteria bacterium]|nr:type II toxin-antitoxin system VapC family toxin [Alphaproteobacteria bacterium]
MAVNWVLDTNAIIYLLAGRLTEPLPDGNYFASVITEMELLCHPDLNARTSRRLRAFLDDLTLVDLTASIRTAAIDFRRRTRLKLPDAIIAATTMEWEATLLSNDRRMARIAGLRCVALPLSPR